MKVVSFLLFILLFSLGALSQERSCDEIIAEENNLVLESLAFIENSIEHNILTKEEFVTWATQILKGKWKNPIPHKITMYGPVFTKSNYSTYYKIFESITNEASFNKDAFREKLTFLLERYTGQILVQEKVVEQTMIPWITGRFAPIDARDSIMQTPITQWMWANILEKNPSRVQQDSPDTLQISVNDKILSMSPDAPVTNVSAMMAMSYIEILNYLSFSDHPLIYKIIPDHQKRKFYHLINNEKLKKIILSNGLSLTEQTLGSLKRYSIKRVDNFQESSLAVDSSDPLLVGNLPVYGLLDDQYVMDTPINYINSPGTLDHFGHIGLNTSDRTFSSQDLFPKKINFERVLSISPYHGSDAKIRLVQSDMLGDIAYPVEEDKVVKMTFGQITYRWDNQLIPIELMQTSVTQWMWAKVMNDNPSKFYYGEDHQVIPLKTKIIPLQPDNPVESIEHSDILAFLDKINQLAVSQDPLITLLVPDFQEGDRFALPSLDFMRWLDSYHCQEMSTFRSSMIESQMNHGWFISNATETTHPVAKKKPIIIQGKEFFDLSGNVTMMSSNFESTFGSHYSHRNLSTGTYAVSGQRTKSSTNGLRLIRIRKN